MTDALVWTYPQDGHTSYEASTFILGSVPHGVEHLHLNGEPILLSANTKEQAFAQVIPLAIGENVLTLAWPDGHSETRRITRIAPWSMPDDSPHLVPVLPELGTTPKLLYGEALAVQVRAPQHVQSVWVMLQDAAGHTVSKAPLMTFTQATLAPEPSSYGERRAIFGELHHDADHPPLAHGIQVFEGMLRLDHPTLQTYEDAEHFGLHYLLQCDDGSVQPIDAAQDLILWQTPRLVEITHESRALYTGSRSSARRHPILPPVGSLFRASGMIEQDVVLQGQAAHPQRFLRGGRLAAQGGYPIPQILDTLSVENHAEALDTTFTLQRACGVQVSVDAQGILVDFDDVCVGLNQAAYKGAPTTRWALEWQDAHTGHARLRYPLTPDAQKALRGIHQQWTSEGLQLRILKRHARWEDLRIMLDPGHGGQETGTHALNGLPEKTWTLQMAKRLQQLLHSAGVGQVGLTREDDVDVSLNVRAARVAAFDADICLSIHANALPDGRDPLTHKGVSVHSTTPWSHGLAASLHAALLQAGRADDGCWENNFAMTRLPMAQSALIEYGYFIHPDDYAELLDDAVMSRLAKATVEGIRASL